MNQIAKFEKVSYEQFKADYKVCVGEGSESEIMEAYNNVRIPERATTGSAGYDFFMPVRNVILNGEKKTIPTGIRCKIEPGWMLCLVPKSGLGCRNGVRLRNTVGIVDSDYYHADNEGHILVCLNASDAVSVCSGYKFVQGIFMPYGVTIDDDTDGERHGGFGSTGE